MIKKVFVGLALVLFVVVPIALTNDSIKDAIEKGEKFEFQAEVNKLLGIIINSLYSNKDIFLRELISNASDALDKIRFASLTDRSVLNSGTELEIRIKADNESNTLSVRDTGIGMTKNDLLNNLGTIAQSGTKSFVEKLQQGEDLNLIGQFGVGFYSAFLAADSVVVVTKHNEDKQYIWESTADSTFSITEDPRGNTLGRGTEIILHLKEDASEYLNEEKLKDLITRYSEFIHFPIYLYFGKEVEREVKEEEEEEKDTEEEEKEEDGSYEEVDVEDESKEDSPKTVTETVYDWEQINDKQPIWTRPTKEISDEEYANFYKTLTKDDGEPLTWTHFTTEGDVSFKSILYVPPRLNDDVFEASKQTGIKLYVRRVFITDEFYDLLPRWLNFLRGIVDSDDLPLNVSRETLQHSRLLKLIKKRLVKKAIDMFKKLADKEEEDEEDEEEDSDSEEAAEDKQENQDKGTYTELWKQFGTNLRLGIIEDVKHRDRLATLLRYYSTKSGDEYTSLKGYVKRMKENQKDIYFITGESYEAVKDSPYLDKLKQKDYEVLFLTDPIDEYVVQSLTKFEDHKLVNIAREGLKLDEDEEKELENKKKEFEPLTKFLKNTLGSNIEKAVISDRVVKIPCMLSSSQWGLTANQERIMKAQALGDKSMLQFMKGRKVMELNPEHPLVRKLRVDVMKDQNLESAKETANLLYDTALLQGGFNIEDTTKFASSIHKMLSTNINEKELEKVEEEIRIEEEKKKQEEEEEGEDEVQGEEEEEQEEEEGHDEL